ncbi:hypothetical protein [Noviherbaspirillum galbum]|uniref:Cytochrome c domain-containing protein n=1 Tax=Noviherbaspirillum galbum TaxID=2709383 RepID=A0A6B3SVT2_9BURK|nr:hypothetical protein [Noviherbaspirillum galbum]NEX64754.1 hypothetical protein [Noviherbaspirillum galbum]
MRIFRIEATLGVSAIVISAMLGGCGGGGDSAPVAAATVPDSVPAPAPVPAPEPAAPAPAPAPAAPSPVPTPAPAVRFAEVNTIIQARCLLCHSAVSGNRTGFNASGLAFDTPAQISSFAVLMNSAIQSRTMPLDNATGMTDAERAAFAQWFAQGANVNE